MYHVLLLTRSRRKVSEREQRRGARHPNLLEYGLVSMRSSSHSRPYQHQHQHRYHHVLDPSRPCVRWGGDQRVGCSRHTDRDDNRLLLVQSNWGTDKHDKDVAKRNRFRLFISRLSSAPPPSRPSRLLHLPPLSLAFSPLPPAATARSRDSATTSGGDTPVVEYPAQRRRRHQAYHHHHHHHHHHTAQVLDRCPCHASLYVFLDSSRRTYQRFTFNRGPESPDCRS